MIEKEIPSASDLLGEAARKEQESSAEPKANKRTQRFFLVSEIFGPTLQGEGVMIGTQTMFIRFAGCDYRCQQCDSLHAVLPALIKQTARRMNVDEIMKELTAKAGYCRTVTFSGGNPCMWDLYQLVSRLNMEDWRIAVETQGTLYQPWLQWVQNITVSPKGPGMGEKFETEKFDFFITKTAFGSAVPTNIKIVVFDQRDIEFAKQIHLKWPTIPMYLSLGNPYPPHPELPGKDIVPMHLTDELLGRMRTLLEDIQNESILHNVKFLPQLHVLLWNNDQGR